MIKVSYNYDLPILTPSSSLKTNQLEYFAGRIAQKALGNAGRKELLDQTYQTLGCNRTDLTGRGVTAGDEVFSLPVAVKGSDWVLTVQFPTPNNQYLYTII